MNERIKELHEKAFDGIDILEANWFLKHNKKFAELIVKECATIARNTDLEDVDGGDSAVLNAASKQIKDHFGVE